MLNEPSNRHPGYLTGKFYTLALQGLTGAAVAAVDTIYLYPFPIYEPGVTVKTLTARVSTGGASSAMKTGIWADSLVSHRPLGAPLIVDNTGVATTATGSNASPDVTDTWLGAGWYWIGTKFRATLPSMFSMGTGPFWMSHLAGASGLFVFGLSFADAYANNMPTFAEGASFTEVVASPGPPVVAIGT